MSLDKDPRDKKQIFFDTLCQQIMSMELAPGSILDEVQLSQQFGLSRSPVREIMRQMAAEGYIDLVPNRPARIAPMDYQALRSFFQAAPLIYVATTQLAAQNAKADDVKRLRTIQAKFREAIENNDTSSRVIYNNAFHLEIGALAKNDYLMPSLKRLLIDHSRLGKMFYAPAPSEEMRADMEKAANQHDEIIQAIADHDVEKAGLLIREHWDISKRRLAEFVIPSGVDVPMEL